MGGSLVILMIVLWGCVQTCYSHMYEDPTSHFSKPPKHVCDNGACDATEGPLMIGRVQGLSRLDGVKVGHRQQVDLGQDGTRTLITRAMRPLLFEIPNFLSDEECDYIIESAKGHGLYSSTAKGGLTEIHEWTFESTVKGKAMDGRGLYSNWDHDLDGKITIPEIQKFAQIQRYMYLDEKEVRQLFKKLNMTELDDDVITREEFLDLNTLLIDSFLYELTRDHPKHRPRFSEQQWLDHKNGDPVLERLFKRVLALTKLSKEIIYGSEFLQVVRYEVGGHYHSHFDSETHEKPEIPCCHQIQHGDIAQLRPGTCKLCRYITILYFLNDVEEGGETAFPVADNATLSKENIAISRAQGKDLFNLNEFCYESNLVVKPKKGTGIMWYNHLLDEESDWLGELDEFSMHGGCALKKGQKWIANNWIPAPYKHDAHIKSTYLPWAIQSIDRSQYSLN